MTITTKTGRQSTGVGALLLEHLAKHGEATTEELATAAKAERKVVAARLWWLWKREGRVLAKGEGAERVWSLPKAHTDKAPAKAASKPNEAASAERRPKKRAKRAKATR